ncbi:MAG: hypothetical protein MPK62_02135 [Alphaproteobacteria bacterium]|nr:hypothetical protein [Alphaproteobacteria bacterium]MDA8029933.1 hypothetical protein [Alphaproteobacteria bacterium]
MAGTSGNMDLYEKVSDLEPDVKSIIKKVVSSIVTVQHKIEFTDEYMVITTKRKLSPGALDSLNKTGLNDAYRLDKKGHVKTYFDVYGPFKDYYAKGTAKHP